MPNSNKIHATGSSMASINAKTALQRLSSQPLTEMPSADTAFNTLIVPAAHASSSNESNEYIEVIENSKQHKKAYERDLINVMMLSSERRFKWQSNFDFSVVAIAFLIGYDATFSFLRSFERIGLMLLCYGVPVMYLELALGQYCSLDSSLIFKRMAPALSAIGYMSWIVAFFAIFASQGIMVICVDLIFASLTMLRDNYVFFETCHKYYNTETCLELDVIDKCPSNHLYYNSGCLDIQNLQTPSQMEYIKYHADTLHRQEESTAQYIQIFITGLLDGWIPFNPPVNVLLWMVACWILLAIVARRGIDFVVKVSYVTMASFFILVVMLFCTGVAIGGAWPSLSFFFEARLEHILDPKIWMDAFIYISICLKLGQSGLITLGSYNNFHSNLFRNLLVISFSSFLCPIIVAFSLTPLYSAFVTRLLGKDPIDYNDFSSALVNFHQYEGITVTVSSLMLFQKMCGAFIFFFAIYVLFLSLGNQYGAYFYTVLSSIFLPIVCSVTAMLEVLTVAYIYGSKKMFSNISAMLFGISHKDRRRGLWKMVPYFNGYMVICWCYLTPLIILVFVGSKIANMGLLWDGFDFYKKLWIIIGFVTSFIVIGYVPLECIIRVNIACWQKKSYLMLFKPHLLLFGPRNPRDRRLAQTQEERWRI